MPRTFVLIHGGWHGAWCWHKLVPLLRAQGHAVMAPDLPSMGEDRTNPATVTLASWTKFVVDLVERQPGRVILLGHSRAGAVISQVAEAIPERIEKLVYLAAYLLPDGRSVAAEARDDPGSLIPSNMVPAIGGVTCTLRPEILRAAFYDHALPEDQEYAISRLSPEPLKPLATPVKVSAERFGRVPRAYIQCGDDRTVSFESQLRMRQVLPCDPVFTLECDHTPFLSLPGPLVRLLGRL